jgi:predicted RNase H-like nuclease (RuvC/YqgF family)
MDFGNELLNSYYNGLLGTFGIPLDKCLYKQDQPENKQEQQPNQQTQQSCKKQEQQSQKQIVQQKIKDINARNEKLKGENRHLLDSIAKNNSSIELNDIELRKLQDQLKAIIDNEQKPINLFTEDVNKKVKSLQLNCGIKEQLDYIHSLIKKLQSKKIQISINKLHSGEYSLMIESEKMDQETRQEVLMLKTLFNMLKSIL